MSEKQTVQIKCPGCGKEGDYEMWINISTKDDPELVELVRNGKLFIHTCPHCNVKTSIDHGYVLHMVEDRIVYYYAESEERFRDVIRMLTKPETEKEKATAQFLANNDYIIRLLTDRVDVQEKLNIYDAGMDDRAIELIKVIAASDLGRKQPDLKYDKVLFSAPENDLKRINFFHEKKLVCSAGIPEELYRKVVKDFMVNLPGLREDHNIRVNAQWAVSVMKNVKGEKD